MGDIILRNETQRGQEESGSKVIGHSETRC